MKGKGEGLRGILDTSSRDLAVNHEGLCKTGETDGADEGTKAAVNEGRSR